MSQLYERSMNPFSRLNFCGNTSTQEKQKLFISSCIILVCVCHYEYQLSLGINKRSLEDENFMFKYLILICESMMLPQLFA